MEGKIYIVLEIFTSGVPFGDIKGKYKKRKSYKLGDCESFKIWKVWLTVYKKRE